MRNHVLDGIIKLAREDERIMLLVGDLGFNVVEGFREEFPKRFINIGIAEQNMSAVAAGLALSGNVVFTYSIANFATLRGIEQIRNDICYHQANVKILAVGCGFAYGDLGMTHHATEDIAMMRSLPYMRVYVPSDVKEALYCLKDAYYFDGPAYIRMTRAGEPDLHKEFNEDEMSSILEIRELSKEVNILCCGSILSEGYKLADMLGNFGVKAGLFSIPKVNPIDEDIIRILSVKSRLLVTLEDHNIIGGLGGAVAETISVLNDNHSQLLRIGLRNTFTEIVGDQNYLRHYYSMDAEGVFPQIMGILKYSKADREGMAQIFSTKG